MITLLDYGAGNVRSVRNAIRKLGFEVKDAATPEDILQAEKLVFPGVGNFSSAIQHLNDLGYIEPLLERLKSNKPFLGICLGLQTAVVEFARNVCGLSGAHSTEFDSQPPYKVIYKMRELVGVDQMGGTMRLGKYPCRLKPSSLAFCTSRSRKKSAATSLFVQ